MKAVVKAIGKLEIVSDKFKKIDVVLTFVGGQYPQHRIHQLTQDKVRLADGLSVGDEVEVEIIYRGREWTSPQGEVKYFNTDEIFELTKVGGQAPQAQAPESDFDF
jgi:hypothetical protein